MGSKSIELLSAVLVELKKLLQQQIDRDTLFLNKLEEHGSKELFERVKNHLLKVHAKVNGNLQTAQSHINESILLAQKNKPFFDSYRKSIPLAKSFFIYLFHPLRRFGLQSEYYFLTTVLTGESGNNSSPQLISTLKNHLLLLHELSLNGRLARINMLLYKENERAKGKIKVRRGLVDFHRPSIKEVVQIYGKKVYLDIFYKHTLTNKKILEYVDEYLVHFSSNLDEFIQKSDSKYQFMQSKLERAKKEMNEIDLKDLQKILIEQLKEVVVNLLKHNPKFITTSSIRYQLTVGEHTQNYSHLFDHFLIEIGIDLLLFWHFFADSFYEIISMDTLGLVNRYKRKSFVSLDKERFKYSSAFEDPITDLEYELNTLSFGRSFSIYTALAHETEHGIDLNYLAKAEKVYTILKDILRKSGFYEDHLVANIDNNLFVLAEFYAWCRQEGTPQLREITMSYSDSVQTLKPMLFAGGHDLFNKINYIIDSIGVRHSRGVFANPHIHLRHLSYLFSHLVNQIIIFAECVRKNRKIYVLKEESYAKLKKLFPQAVKYFENEETTLKQGSPDWFMVQSLQASGSSYFLQALQKNNIQVYDHTAVSDIIHGNGRFYVFGIPLSIVQSVLSKLEKTNELGYFGFYELSCDVLEIRDRLLLPNQVKKIAENLYKLNQAHIQELGFRK